MPRRRATDRLPPVRGVVGALERPSRIPQRGIDRLVPRGTSYNRVASLSGLLGVVLGAAAVYGFVAWRSAQLAAGDTGRSAPRVFIAAQESSGAGELRKSPASPDPADLSDTADTQVARRAKLDR